MPTTADRIVLGPLQPGERNAIIQARHGTTGGALLRAHMQINLPTGGRNAVYTGQWQTPVVTVLKSSLDSYRQENFNLKRENARLRRQLLENVNVASAQNGVETTQLSYEEAKSEIAHMFQKHKKLSYSNIVEELRIDLEVAIRACKELVAEGKIRER